MKTIPAFLDYSRPWRFPNVYLFTGNSTVKNNGAIVMGRGAALQVRDTYLGIDLSFGSLIPISTSLMWVTVAPSQVLGWFKVKNHWADPAELSLIKAAVTELKTLASERPSMLFHMNYPGIGNGKLSVDDVSEIVQTLPDNVLIYSGKAL